MNREEWMHDEEEDNAQDISWVEQQISDSAGLSYLPISLQAAARVPGRIESHK